MTTEAGTKNEIATKIATVNDEFRRTGSMTLTKGVYELTSVLRVIQTIRVFDDFNEDNDPYGEHDFGSFTWEGHKIFWKIDYYDPSFEVWCDPLHPECERVLTVMLAEEY